MAATRTLVARACVITNETTPPEAVTDVPFLGPGLDEDEVLWVQRAYGLTRSLFDSKYNKIALRLDWQASLHAKRWTLVPHQESILASIQVLLAQKAKGRGHSFRILRETSALKIRVYRFVSFNLDTVISRVSGLGPVRTYRPPYDRFPLISSTVYYYLVVVHAFHVFSEHLAVLTPSQTLMYCQLRTCVDLMKELQPGEVGGHSVEGPDDNTVKGEDAERPMKRKRPA